MAEPHEESWYLIKQPEKLIDVRTEEEDEEGYETFEAKFTIKYRIK